MVKASFRKAVWLAAVLVLGVHGQAAQAAAPPATTLSTAMAFSRTLIEALNFKAIIDQAIAPTLKSPIFNVRPDWPEIYTEASTEEIERDIPLMSALIGRELAKNFTLEELQAGQAMFHDPAMLAVIKAASRGEPPPTGLRPSNETIRILQSPAGVSFATKMKNIQQLLEPLQKEFTAAVVPGIMRRFGEKAEAAEARRHVAEGLVVESN
jgi:hypothetical protein